jgi:lipopolysaccharide transport protein LptA
MNFINKIVFSWGVMLGAASALDWGMTSQQDSAQLDTEIDSDDGMTCEKDGSRCWAKGHIRVVRGKSVLTCQQLEVYFESKSDKNKTPQIRSLIAIGQVKITSQEEGSKDPHWATADKATYDPESGVIQLSGRPFLHHPQFRVRDAQTITFHQLKNKAFTKGRATILRQDDLLQGDEIVLTFEPQAQGGLALKEAQAQGDVLLSTAQEMGQGDHGHYDQGTEKVVLTGHAVLTRCDGQVRGHQAMFDLSSNRQQATMTQKRGSSSRVQALLLPQSHEEKK